jgi:hypothetical protein
LPPGLVVAAAEQGLLLLVPTLRLVGSLELVLATGIAGIAAPSWGGKGWILHRLMTVDEEEPLTVNLHTTFFIVERFHLHKTPMIIGIPSNTLSNTLDII